ncbi:amidase family protein [Breoghania sp.]|uniref:amidase family protein n=1 Tax=Breoghania sp. TaxID=2065378 RepID=UPI0029CA78DD|nr:amidase family protein [Breoghania sp.]
MSFKQSFPWSAGTAPTRLGAALRHCQEDPSAKSVFTKTLTRRANMQAEAAERKTSPLAGALISVKALFDVEGEVTTAATKVLQKDAPARADAPCIAALDAAGGVFVGLTNMSEFAYSGIGINPHYGTPDNPTYPGCVPGGSTSGGAVSVALGVCDIAIGSDTGGSLRIPAAFTGITGFKPTQATVSLDGGKALSDTLDSFGPMARSVAACELAWQVMAGLDPQPVTPARRRLVVPSNFGMSELDDAVAAGFDAVIGTLRARGFEIVEKELAAIEIYNQVPPWHLTSVESRAHYEDHFQKTPELFDPRVHARMTRADEISAVDYRQTLNRRGDFVKAFADELGEDLLLLPTTPILPPSRELLEKDDEAFNRLNLLALRNPSLANGADGCAIALPFENAGKVLSAMLVGARGRDAQLLACAKEVEAALV